MSICSVQCTEIINDRFIAAAVTQPCLGWADEYLMCSYHCFIDPSHIKCSCSCSEHINTVCSARLLPVSPLLAQRIHNKHFLCIIKNPLVLHMHVMRLLTGL